MKIRVATFAILLASAAASVLSHPRWELWAMLGMLVLAVGFRVMPAVHFALLCTLVAANILLHRPFFYLNRLGPVLAYLVVVFCIPSLRTPRSWFRMWTFSSRVAALSLAGVVFAIVGLILWVRFAQPDFHPFRRFFPLAGSAGAAWFSVGLFAIANAFAEEVYWRGVVMEATDAAVGPGFVATMIQGAHFGIFHYRGGFPSGVSGAVLAGIFGVLLGALRRKSGGLGVCTLVHTFADATIGILILHGTSLFTRG